MQKLIKKLSYDKAFGILTRPALDIEIEKMKRFDCCLIDFNNLKSLNQLLGYNKVNKIIFSIFEEFKSSNCIIGRWFSGDEVLIVGINIVEKISYLKWIARRKSMSFKELYFINKDFKKIEKEIGDYKNRE